LWEYAQHCPALCHPHPHVGRTGRDLKFLEILNVGEKTKISFSAITNFILPASRTEGCNTFKN
jgi:hypothetical protein